jgi:hypothetical protein
MNEIKHFTNNPETEGIAEVAVTGNDNAYGVTWAEVVREYLKTGYAGEETRCEVEAFGKTYKVLKREGVTAFYDKDGNTLFDVTNDRLEKEYEWFMASGWPGEPEEEMEPGEPVTPMGKVISDIEKQAFEAATGQKPENDAEMVPMGTTSIADIVTGNVPAPTVEEVETAKKANAGDVKAQAKQKLEEELKKAKDKAFADPVISYLLKRCEEDNGLSEDVIQKHKTWDKCFDYIYSQARKQTKGNSCAVRDEVVYEWAEDYYHKDDKAEEEAKAKKEAAAKAKREKAAAEKKTSLKTENSTNKTVKAQTERAKGQHSVEKKEPKPKKESKSKDMDGQLDMFSMMGM